MRWLIPLGLGLTTVCATIAAAGPNPNRASGRSSNTLELRVDICAQVGQIQHEVLLAVASDLDAIAVRRAFGRRRAPWRRLDALPRRQLARALAGEGRGRLRVDLRFASATARDVGLAKLRAPKLKAMVVVQQLKRGAVCG